MMIYSNQVATSGTVGSKLSFNHVCSGEKFYKFFLSVERTSGTKDIIPVIISERIIDVTKDYTNKKIQVIGQLRSYNNRPHVQIYVYALNVFFQDEDTDTNNVFLEGYICKAPAYRYTPLRREITDFTLAVSRMYNKYDYIPCISWGRNAKYLSTLPPKTRVKVSGRFQSREYTKDNTVCTAYELSIISLEIVKEEG